MERFVYKARTKEGKNREGKVEARDVTTAVGVLRERGMVVVSIHPLNEDTGMASVAKFFQKVKFDDVVAFTRQLATMVSSGLPLTESLSVLELQSGPAMSRVIGEIMRDVQGGSSIGDALEKHRDVFSGVYISLVRAGEASGALSDVLKRLATNMEKEKEFKSKTKGALVYPTIVVIGMVVVAAVMMIFVIPKLAAMYEDFGAELPLATQILIGMSDVMSGGWIFMVGGAILAFIGFRYWKNTPAGLLMYDQVMLKLPVMGKLRSEIFLAEMARTVGLLVGSGISLVETLEIVSGVLENRVYQNAIASTIKNVKKGIPFSVTLARQGVFPPLMPNMAAVGEETGKMDEVMYKVANYYEVEAEHTIKTLTTALEPLIMIVLGLGVGFLVISIIMPIYNLTSQF